MKIYESKYMGFGPVLFGEKLLIRHKVRISRETLRKWLLDGGYRVKQNHRRKHREWRERKKYYGEMVQMDGSHHDWLEGRGPKLVLMGYIDDASSRVHGRFYEYEGTIPAMDSFKRYVKKYGIPQSVYLDCHTTYKALKKDVIRSQFSLEMEEALSQFERAMKELDVKVIHAHSPQAKGRVERLFKTLQDRLVKELRLANAKTKDEANKVIESYLQEHNRQFMKEPACRADLHRSLVPGMNLDQILCVKNKHALRNDFTVIHHRKMFQIKDYTSAKRVEIWDHVDGSMSVIGHNRKLKYVQIDKVPQRKRVRLSQKIKRQTPRGWRFGNFEKRKTFAVQN